MTRTLHCAMRVSEARWLPDLDAASRNPITRLRRASAAKNGGTT